MKKPEVNGKSKKENRLEKVVVFLLVVLIALLSFSVGVISGKGLSDKDYALKTMDSKFSHALNTEGTDAAKTGEEGDLSEEEIQQLANAAIQAAEKNGGTAHAAKDEEGMEQEEKAEPKKEMAKHVEKAVAQKTQPTPFGNVAVKGEDERVPSSVSKVGAALEYTVQVAAYPNMQDAESMASTFVKKGYPAFPFKVNIKGTDWYRVSIGSFKSKKEAMQYQADLQKQGVAKDSMVQRVTK